MPERGTRRREHDRPMTPADLRGVVVVEELDLSTDGRLAVIARRSIVGDRYRSHLLAIDLGSGREVPRPRRLTTGSTRDGVPRLSPDGETLAFIRRDSSDGDTPTSIGLLEMGRPGASTTVRMARIGRHGAVGEIAWSPDGRRLAFTADVDPPRSIVGGSTPLAVRRAGGRRRAPTARRILRTDWRWDEVGHRDHWSHLFVIDRPGGLPRQVTSGDWGVADICWHPDGRTVAFSADRGREPDLHPRTTIWAVDVDATDARPREVLAAAGWANHPAWSPDGRWIAAVGILTPEPFDDVSPTVLVGPADGSRGPIDLAPHLDRPVGNWVDCDLNGWFVYGRTGPFWLDDRRLTAIVTDRGRSAPHVFGFDPATGGPTGHHAPVAGDLTTHTMAVARNGLIATLATLGTRAMDLHTLDLGETATALATPGTGPTITTRLGSHDRRRSNLGSHWQAPFAMPVMRLIEAPGPGGPIDVWIASPPGVDPAMPLPTVVDIHGGPLGAWAPTPHLEVILLTGHGYRVVLPNIRGSTSYGADWIRPLLGDWGGVDAADVEAVVDHVVDAGLADPERLGVMGLSYGGFLVNWLVGTTDRFRAAVSENGVTNQVSGWAGSDSGPEYHRAQRLGDPLTPDGVERLWRQSPLRNVGSIRTPLLMLQAEDDRRCPAADNEQLFIALRHLGREVEYILYPEESHVYAAAGRPDRRIDRMTRVLDWFDAHLRT
jgi:dipeptidyl aminopeptidase/acylaminoacyl peptidase